MKTFQKSGAQMQSSSRYKLKEQDRTAAETWLMLMFIVR